MLRDSHLIFPNIAWPHWLLHFLLSFRFHCPCRVKPTYKLFSWLVAFVGANLWLIDCFKSTGLDAPLLCIFPRQELGLESTFAEVTVHHRVLQHFNLFKLVLCPNLSSGWYVYSCRKRSLFRPLMEVFLRLDLRFVRVLTLLLLLDKRIV